MGVIRGRHVSPGVYLKYDTIRMDVVNTDLLYTNTANSVVDGRGGGIPFTVYFGYYPLKSKNGTFTDKILKQLEKIPLKEIITKSTVKSIKSEGDVHDLPLSQHNDVKLPVIVNEDNLRDRIRHGEVYNDIADENNNCVILVVPRYKYEKIGFDIVDERFGFSVYSNFNYIMTKYLNGTAYNVFVMYNNKYAYSRIGVDKVISPIKLRWN